MKFLEKLTKKATKQVSSAVKTEVKKTAIDLLPTALGVVGMVVGIVIFKGQVAPANTVKPAVTNTSITTNNYFFGNVSEEMIKKILEGQMR